MSCAVEIPFILDIDTLLATPTCGRVRALARERTGYRTQQALFILFPEAFKIRGFLNFFLWRSYKAKMDDQQVYVRRIQKMADDGKKTSYVLQDNAIVSLKAGNIRKCAEKGCSDWRKGLEFLFPEAFERARIYPELIPGCFTKSKDGIPCLIRMDEDHARWSWIDLRTGQTSHSYPIYDFEELLAKNGCEIISKEEAFALI